MQTRLWFSLQANAILIPVNYVSLAVSSTAGEHMRLIHSLRCSHRVEYRSHTWVFYLFPPHRNQKTFPSSLDNQSKQDMSLTDRYQNKVKDVLFVSKTACISSISSNIIINTWRIACGQIMGNILVMHNHKIITFFEKSLWNVQRVWRLPLGNNKLDINSKKKIKAFLPTIPLTKGIYADGTPFGA